MERQFHNEDFEKFLKENANQYRMYPSEKVWKGIYSALHTRYRWYAFSALVLLLTSGALITFFALNGNPENTPATETKINPVQSTGKTTPDQSGNKLIAGNNNLKKSTIPMVALQNDPTVEQLYYPSLPEKSNIPTDIIFAEQRVFPSMVIGENDLKFYMEKNKMAGPGIFQTYNSEVAIPSQQTKAKPTAIDNNAENKIKAAMALASKNAPIKTSRKLSRLTAQIYFTPTISYRKLSENKSYSGNTFGQNQFNYIQFIDINEKVKHKPAMGVELGLDNRYAINGKISAKAGFQFNISRYDIGAYFHPTEFATIALNSGNGADSITALSNYRNSSSYHPNWLENFYFQVSVPIGAEIVLFDNKKAQWGVAGTIQPTYNLGERAYLLTSDYKNYVKVPQLMRRWNLNTGIETFVSYSTGRIKWQVGPQVRYQHLSSFESNYPVRENLFNIGLKVGAKINKQ